MSDEKDFASVDVAVYVNSSMERSALYKEFMEQGLTYKQDMGGPLITVGVLYRRPICIAPLIHVIGGVNVLYVETTSMLVDYRKIEQWLRLRLKKDVKIVDDPINLLGEIWAIQRAKELAS